MKTLELVTIGNELLSGMTLNTNAAFIGKKLLESGIQVSSSITIPDERDVILNTFKEVLSRSRVVIVTGGLGPTIDDITKDVAASYFDSTMKLDNDLAIELKSRFPNSINLVESQAVVPEKALIVKNKIGTAPGLIFKTEKNLLLLAPGVPKEMEPMLIDAFIPTIQGYLNNKGKFKTKTLYFYNLYEKDINPHLMELKLKYPRLQFGIYPSSGKVFVVFYIDVSDEVDVEKEVELASQFLINQFSDFYFDFQGGKIEEGLLSLFTKNQLLLSLAESCTGGAISAKLVSIPNASKYLMGSIVCYSNDFKHQFLNISNELLDLKGAVSKECVENMALSLLKETSSDYSLAVSGVAGPLGGTEEKPVGTVFGAIGHRSKNGKEVTIYEFHLHGTRDQIIESTTHRMLFMLYQLVKKNCSN